MIFTTISISLSAKDAGNETVSALLNSIASDRYGLQLLQHGRKVDHPNVAARVREAVDRRLNSFEFDESRAVLEQLVMGRCAKLKR